MCRFDGNFRRYRQRLYMRRVAKDAGILLGDYVVPLAQGMDENLSQRERRSYDLDVSVLDRLKERLEQRKIYGVFSMK
jgi:hypothetical protein